MNIRAFIASAIILFFLYSYAADLCEETPVAGQEWISRYGDTIFIVKSHSGAVLYHIKGFPPYRYDLVTTYFRFNLCYDRIK